MHKNSLKGQSIQDQISLIKEVEIVSEITVEQAISCLQKNLGNDILDPDTMQSLLMANKIDKVRKLHTPAITPPNEK